MKSYINKIAIVCGLLAVFASQSHSSHNKSLDLLDEVSPASQGVSSRAVSAAKTVLTGAAIVGRDFLWSLVKYPESDQDMITDMAQGMKSIYDKGVYGNAKAIAQHVSTHPYETLTGIFTLSPDAEGIAAMALLTLNSGKFVKDSLLVMPRIFSAEGPMQGKVMKASLFMLLASVPAVTAYNSLADAKAQFSQIGCHPQSSSLTSQLSECVQESGNLNTCLEKLESLTANHAAKFDGYAFQLHPSDSHPELAPVSITNYGGGEVCILSGTSPEGLAAKICSNDGFHGNITVEETSMSFASAHEGLTVDKAVYHGAAKLPYTSKCGFFTELPVTENVPGEGTFCVISGFDADNPQQTCMDPGTHQITVRVLTQEQYAHSMANSTEPYTIIFDAQDHNVNTLPDVAETQEPDVTATPKAESQDISPEIPQETGLPQTTEEPCQPTITLFDALWAWWNQKAVEPYCN